MRAGGWLARENQGTNVPTEGSRKILLLHVETSKKTDWAVMIVPGSHIIATIAVTVERVRTYEDRRYFLRFMCGYEALCTLI